MRKTFQIDYIRSMMDCVSSSGGPSLPRLHRAFKKKSSIGQFFLISQKY